MTEPISPVLAAPIGAATAAAILDIAGFSLPGLLAAIAGSYIGAFMSPPAQLRTGFGIMLASSLLSAWIGQGAGSWAGHEWVWTAHIPAITYGLTGVVGVLLHKGLAVLADRLPALLPSKGPLP